MAHQNSAWPALPLAEWEETYTTLHMWTQVAGKIRLALAPMVNHWWQVPLYVTSRGLTTSPMPYGRRLLQIDFDFISHELQVTDSDGGRHHFALAAYSVAEFYARTMHALRSLDVTVDIWTTPVEVPVQIPFEQDETHAAYDAEYVHRFWKILVQTDRLLQQFRAPFTGKVSPVHFFWGAFDMAVTRFSGRPAPAHPGVPGVARYVMEEAYNSELSSAGFWPGAGLGEPAFYAYAYPEPDGFRDYPVEPEAAYYLEEMGEYVLPYEAVRQAEDPDEMVLSFLRTTYEAGAELGEWDRDRLERPLITGE